jgi:hypothetical protein
MGGGSVRIHAARLRAPLAGVPGPRQYQVVPTTDRVVLRLSVRSDVDVSVARA